MRIYKKHSKWSLWVCIAAALLVFVALFWLYDLSSRQNGRDITLSLVDDAGSPLTNADVIGPIDTTFLSVENWGSLEKQADGSGKVLLSSVDPGHYWILINHSLYSLNVPAAGSGSMHMTLECLPRSVALTLHVSQAGANALTDTGVRLQPLDSNQTDDIFYGKTDWKGSLVLNHVPAGLYSVTAQGMFGQIIAIEPSNASEVAANLVCYPDTGALSPQTIRILQSNGRPLQGAQTAVVIYGLPGGKEIVLTHETTDDAGEVHLELSSGIYTLRVGNRRFKVTVSSLDPSPVELRL